MPTTRPGPLPIRSIIVAIGAAVLVTACNETSDGPANDGPATAETGEAPDEATAGSADHPVPHEGGVPLPAGTDVPLPDLDTADVPLEDIVFNTFDGSFLRLSDATSQRIVELRDRIPPIERPRYVLPGDDDLGDDDLVDDDDLVLGYVATDGQPYAFPIAILNFHEIINDEFAGEPVLITYCPLCRSGIVYDRTLDGDELTFGNTSALFDNDLVMYDHQTGSFWWHVAGRALVGERAGRSLTPLPSSMATWDEWLGRHPDTLVLSSDTGFDRPYGRGDPFAGYQDAVDDGHRGFPGADASRQDDRLRDGEDVLGIVLDDEARAYPLRQLGDAVINDELADTPLVVVSRAAGPSGVAFDRRVDGQTLTFAADGDGIVDEQTGSQWTRAGRAIDGPLEGSQLDAIPVRSSFWFAFVASFPDTDVFDAEASDHQETGR